MTQNINAKISLKLWLLFKDQSKPYVVKFLKFPPPLPSTEQTRTCRHLKNSQKDVRFGQISKIFESWINLQLQLQTQKWGHRHLWNVQIHQFKGLALSKQSSRSENLSSKIDSTMRKITSKVLIWICWKMSTLISI